MANLTLMIDDDLLRRARIRALERGTSVNALVRDYLRRFAGRDETTDPLDAFFEVGRQLPGWGSSIYAKVVPQPIAQ